MTLGVYEEGICRECGKTRLIVHKKLWLCHYCNETRKSEIKVERQKLKPPKVFKQLKRTPVRKISAKGKKTIGKDEIIYETLWNTKPHYCEECNTFLGDDFRDDDGKIIDRFRYSHILSKGAWPQLRHYLENFNLLCRFCHDTWEFGDKKSMKIWPMNEARSELLKSNLLK